MYTKIRALLFRRYSLPKERAISRAIRSFSIAERVAFYFFLGIFMSSSIALLAEVNNQYLVEVPVRGGTLTEGVIGNPRFINPVLAISEADKNLTTLVYSGLVKVTPEGQIENDLADIIDISEDGLTYTVHIRESARFHDAEPVTADDVIFTIQKIVDPLIKSPRRGNWDGVSLEKLDEYTIAFRLKEAYAPFLDNLTVGILPRHIWKNVTQEEFSFSQFNTLPVGSGPYKIVKVERNSGGIPNYYRLAPFDDNSNKTPFIKNLIFKFYPSEQALLEAYARRDISSFGGLSPEKVPLIGDNSRIVASPLPRVFAIFFNPTQSKVFLDKSVRQALDLAAPKEEIIDQVLGGYATAIDGPMPAGLFSWSTRQATSTLSDRFAQAEEILAKAGWLKNKDTGILEKKSGNDTIELSFSISTGDVPELRHVAEILKETWENLGASVSVMVFEPGDLNQNVIRPRNFDALLFGEVVGRDSDVYPFWHSSQRNDPGLNIALYANPRADRLLEVARSSSDPVQVEESYKSFAQEVMNDIPAVFLYTPSFLYVQPNSIENASIGSLSAPQDRFLGIRDWYIDTDKIWKVFVPNNN